MPPERLGNSPRRNSGGGDHPKTRMHVLHTYPTSPPLPMFDFQAWLLRCGA